MATPHRQGPEEEEEAEAEEGESPISLAYLGRRRGLACSVWAPRGRGCMTHHTTLPLPIFPIHIPPHSQIYLGLHSRRAV